MKPILDRVIIKQEKPQEKTKGGIILADTAKQQSPRGKIVSVGPKVKDVSAGDYVLFNVNWKQVFHDDGEEYVTVNEKDILAVLSHEAYVQMETVK